MGLSNWLHDLSGLVINAGRVDMLSDGVLGTIPVIVNPAGTLRYTTNTSTSRTFTLNGGTLEVGNGAILTMNGATANGGLPRHHGHRPVLAHRSCRDQRRNSLGGTTVNVNGPAAFNNVTTGANVTVAAGQTLTLNRGLQTAAGTLIVHGTANATAGWESTGVIRIPGGTTPGRMMVSGAPLVLFDVVVVRECGSVFRH